MLSLNHPVIEKRFQRAATSWRKAQSPPLTRPWKLPFSTTLLSLAVLAVDADIALRKGRQS